MLGKIMEPEIRLQSEVLEGWQKPAGSKRHGTSKNIAHQENVFPPRWLPKVCRRKRQG